MKNRTRLLFLLAMLLAGFTGFSQDSSSIVTNPERKIEFKGGMNGWVSFLEKNMNRDLPAKEGAPVGRYQVWVSFLIDTVGRVSDIVLEKDPGYGAGKEVKRIVRLSDKKWTPAYDKGKPVLYRHTQSITFVVN
jgi:protein TonB